METKPHRDQHGMPVAHADLVRAHIERTQGRRLEAGDLRSDELRCPGVMEYHGEKKETPEGNTFVDWEGTAIHAELHCSECGTVWVVDTAFKRHMTEPETKEASW